jgi:RNA polymerase sigma-70 factor (ECF subfamily)
MMAQAGSSAMTGAIDLAWAWRALAAMALVRDEGSPRDRDLELIEAIRSGDKRASVLLFRRHAGEVYRRLTRLVGPDPEREDLTQEVFIAAFRGLDRFRGDAAFSTWLHSVVVNVAYSHLRRRRRQPYTLDVLLDTVPVDPSLGPEGRAAQRQELARALTFLDRLKPDKRIAFVLRVIEGLSLQEIAVLVKATPPAVGQRVRHAQLEIAAMAERDARRRREEAR